MSNYDANVIGAGNNGLSNAALLEIASLKVLVVEKNENKGSTVSQELHEGWKYSNCFCVCSQFGPVICHALDLGRHGVKVIPQTASMTCKQDGGYSGVYNHPNIRRCELMRRSLRDAKHRRASRRRRQCYRHGTRRFSVGHRRRFTGADRVQTDIHTQTLRP